MNRIEIINALISKYSYQSYLEIGTQTNKAFDQIICAKKIGVDPAFFDKWNPTIILNPTFKLTSDEFFKQNEDFFDIIFIDGLHQCTQVYKDILNSLKFLNPEGIIVCHDMLPSSRKAQLIPRKQRSWNGDCWMAFVWLRATRSDLKMHTIQTDHGTSIIKRGEQECLRLDKNITYRNFVKNKKVWLNLITVEQFEQLYLLP